MLALLCHPWHSRVLKAASHSQILAPGKPKLSQAWKLLLHREKKKKIHPSSQKAPYAASADSPREDAWLNQGEMPPPWIQEGTRRGGLSHPARDGHHGGHGLAKMPPRAGTPRWDGHPPQWHPQMGSVGHPSITPAISGWFPLSHPRQHPSLPAPPTLLNHLPSTDAHPSPTPALLSPPSPILALHIIARKLQIKAKMC